MREILFRGQRADNKEWVIGDSLVHSMYKKGDVCVGVVEGLEIYSVIPESVSEFTGLTDKNGTKIFEGDIIMWGLAPCVAKYDTENARFMFYENGKHLKNGFNADTMEMKEVIGNIHDNPELLGGETE